MATESLAREYARRREWFDVFTCFVSEMSTDPDHRPTWRDARALDDDGYTPYQAAVKYCAAHHLGPNS